LAEGAIPLSPKPKKKEELSLFNDFLKFGNTGRVIIENIDEDSIKDQRFIYLMQMQRRKSQQGKQNGVNTAIKDPKSMIKYNQKGKISISKQVEINKMMKMKQQKEEEQMFIRNLSAIAEHIVQDYQK